MRVGAGDHDYTVSYEFSVQGKKYTGSTYRHKVYDITKLPRQGSRLTVRYLPQMPAINGEKTGLGGLSLRVILLGGLGGLLLVTALLPRRKAAASTSG